jgi:hypothetical protein
MVCSLVGRESARREGMNKHYQEGGRGAHLVFGLERAIS